MARKKTKRATSKVKRAVATKKRYSRPAAAQKETRARKPMFGDFAHSLYWEGGAAVRSTDHLVTHQIIFVERTRRRAPNYDHRDYSIPSGSPAEEVAQAVARNFEAGPYHQAAPRGNEVVFVVSNDFFHVMHVFYTDYYPKGVVVNDDGTRVKIFGPDSDLEVWARTQ